MLVDETEHVLRVGAAPSLPPDYVREADRVEIGPEAGSCGTAAYFATPVVVAGHPDRLPLGRSTARSRRRTAFAACWSTPIMASSGDRVLGTFAVYYANAE